MGESSHVNVLLDFRLGINIQMKSGKVESLWRYPVKSLIGENLDIFYVTARGVSGDREYSISNAEGKFGSGKNTRRFRRIDGLFSMSAKTLDNEVSITLPDGKVLCSCDTSINDKLSEILGQNITLTKEAKISHFDDGAIHILSTSSLSLLQKSLPDSGIDVRRFRPNIVIDSQYIDDELIGKTIKIGEIILEITHKTQRCRMISLKQLNIEKSPEILKSVSKNFGLYFGVYARVISTGSISIGDHVEFLA